MARTAQPNSSPMLRASDSPEMEESTHPSKRSHSPSPSESEGMLDEFV